MTLDDKIRDEKIQYGLNKEATKIQMLSFAQIEKCEYITGEEILRLDQRKKSEFTCSPLGKI